MAINSEHALKEAVSKFKIDTAINVNARISGESINWLEITTEMTGDNAVFDLITSGLTNEELIVKIVMKFYAILWMEHVPAFSIKFSWP